MATITARVSFTQSASAKTCNRAQLRRPALQAAFRAQANRGSSRQAFLVRAAGITEVTKDTFYPLCESNDKLVVLDCFTSWCGPCKLIYPQLEELANKYESGVEFAKLNCNQENKELGKALGVKVVPTFFFFKGKEQGPEAYMKLTPRLRQLLKAFPTPAWGEVGMVSGAKPDEVEKTMVELLEKDWKDLGFTVAALEAEHAATAAARA